jgi:hypothetical protein
MLKLCLEEKQTIKYSRYTVPMRATVIGTNMNMFA